MKLRKVAELLNARVLTDESLLENEVENVFCSDMMAEVHCVVFPEEVEPPAKLLALAELHDIVVMSTERTMFEDVETLLDAGLSDAAWV